MQPDTLTAQDHAMISVAAKRGPVTVTTSTGSTTARLLAWRPRKKSHDRQSFTRRNVARVRFQSGREASVPCEAVTPIVGET